MISHGDERDNDSTYAYHNGRKAGIKEVADWISVYGIDTILSERNPIHLINLSQKLWQAKLDEWGVE